MPSNELSTNEQQKKLLQEKEEANRLKEEKLQNEIDNSKLIYDYTLFILKTKSDCLDSLDNRLLAVLALCFFMLILVKDLDHSTVVLLISKILVLLTALSGVIFSLRGLRCCKSGVAIHPESLLSEEIVQKHVAAIRFEIARKWVKGCESFDQEQERKSRLLNTTIWIAITGLMVIVFNIFLNSWLGFGV